MEIIFKHRQYMLIKNDDGKYSITKSNKEIHCDLPEDRALRLFEGLCGLQIVPGGTRI